MYILSIRVPAVTNYEKKNEFVFHQLFFCCTKTKVRIPRNSKIDEWQYKHYYMITVIMYFLSVSLLFLFAITVLLSIMTICVFCKRILYDLISSISYISNINCAFYAYKISSTRTRVEKGACPFLSILLNDLSKIIISGRNG